MLFEDADFEELVGFGFFLLEPPEGVAGKESKDELEDENDEAAEDDPDEEAEERFSEDELRDMDDGFLKLANNVLKFGGL